MAKIIDIKDVENQKEKSKKNPKKLIIIIIGIVLAILLIIGGVLYASNKQARNFMDKYIFRKNITQSNVPTIDIDYDTNNNVIPYGKYICILTENNLYQYNSSGKKEQEVKIEINQPVYDTNGKYLIIGEKNSHKAYLISGNTVLWEKDIDGNIAKVAVNKNGYTSIIITGTTYKSVIITYDTKGNELFKIYLKETIAVDSCFSQDNEYLAFAEINTSGTVIQSNIKVISVAKAKAANKEEEPVIYTYAAPQGSMTMRIKYQDKNRLVCMYDNSIHVIESDIDTTIMELNESGKKITFADIELNNFAYRTIEKSTGLFSADTAIEMMNIATKKENVYTIEGIAKSVASYGDVIAVNLGSEVDFVNTNSWLIKRYTSTQEVRKIVLCDGLAGIIYRDKIELISL